VDLHRAGGDLALDSGQQLAYVDNVPAAYSITETPAAVQLVFTYRSGPSATAGNVWTLNLPSTATSGSISIPIAAPPTASAGAVSSVTPSAGASGTSLPDGVYSVVAKYQTAAAPGSRTTIARTPTRSVRVRASAHPARRP
jgi:hypothetical protein